MKGSMKTTRILMITVAAVLFLGGVTQIHAADQADRPAAFRGRFLERVRQRLGLTDEQTAQIKAVLKSDKDNLTSLLGRMHEARIGLREAIRAQNPTEASVRAASAKVAAVQADLAVERMKLFARINPILTDEQRAKLALEEQQVDDLADAAIARASERLAE